LHFLHALTDTRKRVSTFRFGTRLSNVTRALRARDPDDALAACSASVPDWSGGTRIASSLHAFNKLWARRVLTQGAIVLLITDGLERDADDTLAFEIDRLHRSCRRLVWLNPLLRFEGFEARARGIKTMLPHVDEFRPINNLESMAGLVAALRRGGDRAGGPKAGREKGCVRTYIRRNIAPDRLTTKWRRICCQPTTTFSKPPRTGAKRAGRWRSPPWSRPGARRRDRSAPPWSSTRRGLSSARSPAAASKARWSPRRST